MAAIQHDDIAIAAISEVKQVGSEKHDPDVKSVSDSEPDLDGIHDGLTFPTQEELLSLRRVSDAIPWNAYLIAFVELAERFSFYGCSVVYTNFIQWPLPPGSHTGAGGANGQSGALGMGQQASTGLTTFNQFWCYITPLIGAYIADTYWGRYKTICWAVVFTLLGHIILIITGLPGVIEHKSSIGAFCVAIIIIGFGSGLFKANISPLIAEQYPYKKLFVVTTKKGERVIVDPAMTISRIYMYFYLFINVGALVGQISMAFSEKYVGFWVAYTLPTIVYLICPVVLWYGRNRYIKSPPTGSVLGTVTRLWFYAAKGKWSLNPHKTYKNLTSPNFWENAKPSNVKGTKPRWMTFDDKWVDEVRRGFKACAVFCWFPIYWLTYNQLNGNLVSQAATMSTHGLPNEVLSNLDPFALIIFIPICDLLIYPALRRGGLNFTALKKITLGFFLGAAAMVWAAVVQAYIYKTSPCGEFASECEGKVSPLNVWIQSGSYVLVAFSEILASITGLEYAYTKGPKNMKSLVTSIFLFTSALASALGEAFVALARDPLLIWNYGVMAVLATLTGCLVWISVFKLDRQEDELNQLAEGRMVDPNKKD
ncbi:hypothetical protein Agabi119p4_10761 [Agaricus bisporus var. burnettii]|uniref:Peptide transporter PTR2A n=1 Tax=Agaricus bisporus var. burnettii TaxID=192524 RepID=A0A8H7C145_AGABI|nr:hypothetical protein Agabi119p4_10761 [Agaricus bisporus var. burnettii]